jgi:hypothetical protein
MATYGFDRLIYGFTRFMSLPRGLGHPDDLLVLSNMDAQASSRGLHRRAPVRRAPMVRWASQNTGACSWRWMQENEASFGRDARQIIEFNKQLRA